MQPNNYSPVSSNPVIVSFSAVDDNFILVLANKRSSSPPDDFKNDMLQ